MLGKRFGYLVVILDDLPGGVKRKVLVECDCGVKKRVCVNNLRTGNTKSCGCYKKERIVEASKTHGGTYTRLYSTWSNIKARCNNPNNSAYKFYGGVGIKVSKDWIKFESFKDWALSNGYEDSLSIDRIDSTKDYSSNNCRWISQSDNSKKMWNDTGRRVVSEYRIILARLLNTFGISLSKCAHMFKLKPHTLIAAVNRANS